MNPPQLHLSTRLYWLRRRLLSAAGAGCRAAWRWYRARSLMAQVCLAGAAACLLPLGLRLLIDLVS